MVISHIISAQREMSKTGDPVEKGSHTIHDVGLIEFAGAVAFKNRSAKAAGAGCAVVGKDSEAQSSS